MRRVGAGLADRERPLEIVYDGTSVAAFRGDTLASALLGAGERVVAQSAVLGRPRGIVTAGSEEPCAWVQVEAPRSEPLVAATRVEAIEGLVARGLAGHGRLVQAAAADRYEKRYAHCDVLVIGAGPAGLMAGLTAALAGARTILADGDFLPGGDLLRTRALVAGQPGHRWAAAAAAEIAAQPEAQVLLRADAVGAYDGNGVQLVERVAEHLDPAIVPPGLPRRRLWQIRARSVVLATGSLERPFVFPGNDRPGVMLAGAARAYASRWGVVPDRAVVFTSTDAGHELVADLIAAGSSVAAIVDARAEVSPRLRAAAAAAGVELLAAHGVLATSGSPELSSVEVAPLASPGGPRRSIPCDVLAVSGGFDPVLDLHLQRGGATSYDGSRACLLASGPVPGQLLAGAAAGHYGLAACLEDGRRVGVAALQSAGISGAGTSLDVPAVTGADATGVEAFWAVPIGEEASGEAFVDLNRDVTVRDLAAAIATGLDDVEHVKRLTLTGTGADQGRTAKLNAAAIVAGLSGLPLERLATSSTRPPAQPVAFAVLAGGRTGSRYAPLRTTPIHPWHVEHGAVFENVGLWNRPRYYPRAGEDMDAAVARECRAARERVALMDASTLGKIDVRGPDALELLERLYVADLRSLAIGRCRYALMCGADGIVLDDGVVARLGEERYVLTTTTGNAATVYDWIEEWLQTTWPSLRAWVTSVTEQWATIAVVGPRSRDVLAAVAPDLPVGREDFRFMTVRGARVAEAESLVARVSFSGELAFEVWAPGEDALGLWRALWAAGTAFGIEAYGIEATHVLRAEKGYAIVGQETDRTTTPGDIGLDWLVSTRKDFVGRRSLRRPDALAPGRRQLVSLLPEDPATILREGAQLTASGIDGPAGHVTASHHSSALGRSFALALLADGRGRHGELVEAHHLGEVQRARVSDPVLYDPEGGRRDGD